MSFQVLWVPTAEQELAAIWIASSDRGAVTEAANKIDVMLRADPEVGESRDDGQRIFLEPPLGVIFKAKPRDRIVLVLSVWLFEGRRPRS